MLVIIFAILLMRISFVNDLPSMNMDYSTYISKFKTTVTIPIGFSPSYPTTNLDSTLQSNYNNKLNVQSILSATSDI
jgi:hypothetical protein